MICNDGPTTAIIKIFWHFIIKLSSQIYLRETSQKLLMIMNFYVINWKNYNTFVSNSIAWKRNNIEVFIFQCIELVERPPPTSEWFNFDRNIHFANIRSLVPSSAEMSTCHSLQIRQSRQMRQCTCDAVLMTTWHAVKTELLEAIDAGQIEDRLRNW